MRSKTIFLTLVMLTITLVFTACAQPATQTVVQEVVVTATPESEAVMEPVTLTMWDFKSGDPVFAPYTSWAIEQFQEIHPNVTVELVPQPNNEYYNLLGAAIAAGEGPDVILIHGGTRLTERQDLMIPLDDYIGDEADKFINLQNGWANDETGEILSLPITIQGFVYYYNKNIFTEAGLDPEKPPTTWDELVATCDAIIANTDKSCFTAGGKEAHGMQFYGSLYAASMFTAEDHAEFLAGEIPYDDPRMSRQLELWYDASQRGWWQEGVASETTYMDSHDNFSAGRAAITQGLISDIAHWKMFGDYLGANNVGMFKNVVIDPDVYATVEDIPIAAGGGIGWSVPNWSEHPDEAVQLVEFLASPEAQLVLFNSAATIIPRNDIDANLISDPAAKQINEWLANAEMPTFYVTPTDLNAEWKRQSSLLLLGEITPEEATQAMVNFAASR
ncbi:MAG: extracellular solute-binding protein [Chloroflexi bacterium]|nr:extracellular solute-binding protein [Chloroflexota bacterium]